MQIIFSDELRKNKILFFIILRILNFIKIKIYSLIQRLNKKWNRIWTTETTWDTCASNTHSHTSPLDVLTWWQIYNSIPKVLLDRKEKQRSSIMRKSPNLWGLSSVPTWRGRIFCASSVCTIIEDIRRGLNWLVCRILYSFRIWLASWV